MNEINGIQDLVEIEYKFISWMEYIKENCFKNHGSDSPDQRFAEMYWEYSDNFESHYSLEKAIEKLEEFFQKLNTFLSETEENIEYPMESKRKYKYKK